MEKSTESAGSIDKVVTAEGEISKLVPEAGRGRRWWDPLYRVLDWSLRGWPRRFLPRALRYRLNDAINWILPLHQHERELVRPAARQWRTASVPVSEHLALPAIWVVELFTPSTVHRLEQAIRRNGWDRRRLQFGHEENAEILMHSRSGVGWTWWRIADIAGPTGFVLADGMRARLPTEFRLIELSAVQIGSGLTAVVGSFHISESAYRRLDEEWHAERRPELLYGKGRPRSLDRVEAAAHRTQEARTRLHTLARTWMRRASTGSLGEDARGQTLIDLILLDKFDPYRTTRPAPDIQEGMRTLGLLTDIYHRTSKQLPGLVLEAPSRPRRTSVLGGRTWTLWGQRARATRGLRIPPHDKDQPDNSIAHEAGESMRYVLVELAISDLLQQMLETQAATRDLARRVHGKLRRRNLATLRDTVLTQSLDIATLGRDLAAHAGRRWRLAEEADFDMDLSPWEVKADRTAGRKRFRKENFSAFLRERSEQHATELLESDRELRAILTTAASLNSSIDARTSQRIALGVSVGSLIVALIALVGIPRLGSLWGEVVRFVTSWFV